MHCSLSLAIIFSFFASSSSAVAIPNTDLAVYKNRTNLPSTPLNVPVTVKKAELIDYVSDNKFNPAIYRDGGGGGYINGYHVISFADTWTTGSPGKYNSPGTSFVHNSFAYFGYRNKNNPTNMYDFGSKPNGDGVRTFMSTGLAALGNETTVPYKLGIWPNSNMVPISGKQALGVYSVYNITQSAILYNTVALIDVLDPDSESLAPGNTISVERVVPRLFYATENLYGSFCIYKSMGWKGEPDDGYLYLFATSSNGIKMARVKPSNVDQRHSYKYWDGSEWSSTQPVISHASANMIPWTYYDTFDDKMHGPGSGEVFWSAHLQTYATVFFGDGIDAVFYISYSTSKQITGPWSVPQKIYDPGTNKKCVKHSPNWSLNYAGHAYPAWDPTGKTLLLSWSSCNAWTSMATVTLGST